MSHNSTGEMLFEPVWFKSSYSTNDGPSCIEVAEVGTGVHVRDSKNVPGPQLDFGSAAWADFVAYTSRG